jgi:hypothetical protein
MEVAEATRMTRMRHAATVRRAHNEENPVHVVCLCAAGFHVAEPTIPRSPRVPRLARPQKFGYWLRKLTANPLLVNRGDFIGFKG